MVDAPDPEGMSLLAKVITAGIAVIGPAWGFWAWLDRRFARKHTVANQFQAVTSELATQRGHIGKLFDKLREAESKNEERHRELLMHLLERKTGG